MIHCGLELRRNNVIRATVVTADPLSREKICTKKCDLLLDFLKGGKPTGQVNLLVLGPIKFNTL